MPLDVSSKIEELAQEISTHADWWLFPKEEIVQGFVGTGDVFIVGDQPSTNEWRYDNPNRRCFYDLLQRVGLENAHITDLYKKRGRAGALRNGIPSDFSEHMKFFQRELDLLKPKRIIALGKLAEELLIEHIAKMPNMFSRTWHFSYVVRFKKQQAYEQNLRAAISLTPHNQVSQKFSAGATMNSTATIEEYVTKYSHSRLCFKAEVIEPLGMDDRFCIITNVGTFSMTKREFYKTFPNVLKSRSYRQGNRIYHYPNPPGKSFQFRINNRKK